MRSSSRVTEVVAYVVSLLLGVVFVMLWLHVVDSPPTFAHWTGAFPVIAAVGGGVPRVAGERGRAGAIATALTTAAGGDPAVLSEARGAGRGGRRGRARGRAVAGRGRLKLSELGEYPLVIPQRALAPG